MKAISFSRKGDDRKVNEDYAIFKIDENNKFGIFAVADGMGELDYGNEASKLVVNSIMDYIEDNRESFDCEATILSALEYADTQLEDFSMRNHCVSGVAIAVGVVVNNILSFTWQGNVRIYREVGSGWELLTTDHKLPVGKRGYRLTRCLKGQGLREDIPIRSSAVFPGHYLLVCTDGLYECLERIDDIAEKIKTDTLETTCRVKDDATGIFIEI